MSLSGKLISYINVLYLLLIISLPLWGSSLLGFVSGLIGLVIIALPVLLGLISSILYYQKNSKTLVKPKKTDRILAAVPPINFALILVLILLIR